MSRQIALLGCPNSGKTTLFNWLTGSRFKTANYPGATTQYFLGETLEVYGESFLVVDTPGTYSLVPKSPEEQVTFDCLFSEGAPAKDSLLVCVIDATRIAQQAVLIRQLKESGRPFVIALTMADLLKDSDQQIFPQALEKHLGAPVVMIDGRLGGGLKELVQRLTTEKFQNQSPLKNLNWDESWFREGVASFKEIGEVAYGKNRKALTSQERTRKLDRVLLHPVLGLFTFFAVMLTYFVSIFWLADPLMGYVDEGFGKLAEISIGLFGAGLFGQFLSDGVIASFGAVFVFVPQIFILFLGLTFLEDSGYLARASTLIDRPLSFLGLSGRSFVPLLSGLACAVPAMMSARTIQSRAERWITVFTIPLMSCSARLPVYALILSFVFWSGPAWKAGLALMAIYIFSILVTAVAAKITSFFVKDQSPLGFMMDLPLYRRPRGRILLRTAWARTMSYVRRAGPVIFVFAVLLWGASQLPRVGGEAPQLSESYLGKSGKMIEPVFEPMGGDWRVGVSLLSAFAAREVFVSSLALVFGVGGDVEDDSQGLIDQMRGAVKRDGTALFSIAHISALLVFFVIALQCMSTSVMALKEMNSMAFAVLQFVVLNLFAYVSAVAVYQVFSI